MNTTIFETVEWVSPGILFGFLAGAFTLLLRRLWKVVPYLEGCRVSVAGEIMEREDTCVYRNFNNGSRFQPESMISNRHLIPTVEAKTPVWQCGIYAKSGETMHFLGSGNRIGAYLLIPFHITVTAIDLYAGRLVKSSTKKPMRKYIRIIEKPIHVSGDLVAFRMPDDFFTTLQMRSAKVGFVDGKTLVSITSSAPPMKDSGPETAIGDLCEDVAVFGGLVFGGSTRRGFSGAGYVSGSSLLGIHLGGGPANYGIAASYVMALLSKPEGTAEWLESVRKQKGKIRFQRTRDVDEVIVNVNGRYHTVDRHYLSEEDVMVYADGELDVDENLREPEVAVFSASKPGYVDTDDLIQDTKEIVERIESKNFEVAESLSSASAMEEDDGRIDNVEEEIRSLKSHLQRNQLEVKTLRNELARQYQIGMDDIQKEKDPLVKKERINANTDLKAILTEVGNAQKTVNVLASSALVTGAGSKTRSEKKKGKSTKEAVEASLKRPLIAILKDLEKSGALAELGYTTTPAPTAPATTDAATMATGL